MAPTSPHTSTVPAGSLPAGDCVVCLDAGATHLVAPCGHQCLCTRCAAKLRTCPVCRASVQLCVRVYASGAATGAEKCPPKASAEPADAAEIFSLRAMLKGFYASVPDEGVPHIGCTSIDEGDVALVLHRLEELGCLSQETLRETRIGNAVSMVATKTQNDELRKRAQALMQRWRKRPAPTADGDGAGGSPGAAKAARAGGDPDERG